MIGPNTFQALDAFVPERLRDLQAEAARERLLRSARPQARPAPRAGRLPGLVLTVVPAALCCPQAA